MHGEDEKSAVGKFGNIAKAYREIGPYLGLGLQLAVTIVVFFLVGRWLDGVFETSPILMVVGGFIGAAAGLYSFLRTVLSLSKKHSGHRETGRDAPGNRQDQLNR